MIVVTTPTGQIGSQVLDKILDGGEPVRVIARDPLLLDMAVAKDNGLDNDVARTPQSTTPTTFRQWCEEVLKPAVLA